MKRSNAWWMLPVVMAMACSVTAVRSTRADDAAAMPSYRGDMMTWIKQGQDELEQLAAAMPEKKYSWRPSKGVRSVSEVYMHVAQANYGVTAMMGVTPPSGFKFEDYDKSQTAKAEVQKTLHESFDHLEKAFSSASEADLDKSFDFMGNKMTGRSAYMLLLSHIHEHLGQSIAYARMNGVAPPWTAKQQAAMKTQMDKMKDMKK
jgi:uncharacterized damage-inducible protein DinB